MIMIYYSPAITCAYMCLPMSAMLSVYKMKWWDPPWLVVKQGCPLLSMAACESPWLWVDRGVGTGHFIVTYSGSEPAKDKSTQHLYQHFFP